MDPNANITEQREIAQRLVELPDAVYAAADRDNGLADAIAQAARLAELVVALDEWRQKGGFDPYGSPVTDELRTEVKDALEGGSNDAEHNALVSVAQEFGIEYIDFNDYEE